MIESILGGSISLEMLAFLFVAGTLAAFIDSIVGGGGLISVPAILLTGLPPSLALGSNKCASVVGAATAALAFLRAGHVEWSLLKKQIPFTFIGSLLGTWLVVHIPPLYLKPILIVLLAAVLIFVLFKKDWGTTNDYEKKAHKVQLFALIFAFSIGLYDGFIGPGTGTFLIFCFLFMGFNFLKAAGNAKILNFTSNLASMMLFLALEQVNFAVAIAMALGQVLGASLGARLAIAKGAALVRILFIAVTSTMIIKLAYDYLQGGR